MQTEHSHSQAPAKSVLFTSQRLNAYDDWQDDEEEEVVPLDEELLQAEFSYDEEEADDDLGLEFPAGPDLDDYEIDEGSEM